MERLNRSKVKLYFFVNKNFRLVYSPISGRETCKSTSRQVPKWLPKVHNYPAAAVVEEPPTEQPKVIQDFGTPLPGSEGDEWEEFNNLMGSKQASTDQEQE